MDTARENLKLSQNFKLIFVLSKNKKIIRWYAVVAKNQRKITYDREFSIVKSSGLKYMNF